MDQIEQLFIQNAAVGFPETGGKLDKLERCRTICGLPKLLSAAFRFPFREAIFNPDTKEQYKPGFIEFLIRDLLTKDKPVVSNKEVAKCAAAVRLVAKMATLPSLETYNALSQEISGRMRNNVRADQKGEVKEIAIPSHHLSTSQTLSGPLHSSTLKDSGFSSADILLQDMLSLTDQQIAKEKFDEKMTQGLEEIDKASKNIEVTYVAAKGHPQQNRYVNVLAPDHSRVQLKGINNSAHTDYINANYLKQPSESEYELIATQGPMDATKQDFLSMVHGVVIRWGDPWESGKTKYSDSLYPNPKETTDNGRYTLAFSGEDYVETAGSTSGEVIKVAKLIKTEIIEGKTTTTICYDIHVTCPDHSAVSPETMAQAVQLSKKYAEKAAKENGQNTSPYRIVAHCSAGLGRTGMFAACFATDEMLSKSDPEAIKNFQLSQVIKQLRTDRPGTIQTAEQLGCCMLFARNKIRALSPETSIGERRKLDDEPSALITLSNQGDVQAVKEKFTKMGMSSSLKLLEHIATLQEHGTPVPFDPLVKNFCEWIQQQPLVSAERQILNDHFLREQQALLHTTSPRSTLYNTICFHLFPPPPT